MGCGVVVGVDDPARRFSMEVLRLEGFAAGRIGPAAVLLNCKHTARLHSILCCSGTAPRPSGHRSCGTSPPPARWVSDGLVVKGSKTGRKEARLLLEWSHLAVYPGGPMLASSCRYLQGTPVGTDRHPPPLLPGLAKHSSHVSDTCPPPRLPLQTSGWTCGAWGACSTSCFAGRAPLSARRARRAAASCWQWSSENGKCMMVLG